MLRCTHPLTEVEKAYIDGEGSIFVARTSTNRWGWLIVTASNLNREVLEWLQKRVGGKTYRKTKGRDIYYWRIYSKQALNLLKHIQPYLIIKRQLAELAIQWQQTKIYSSTAHIPTRVLKQRQQLERQMKWINYLSRHPKARAKQRLINSRE